MTEQEFLEMNIFYGLKDVNGGCDADSMCHFSAEDFKTIMDRAEDLNVRILGIECWEHEEEKYTAYYEDYKMKGWHRNAYENLMKDHSPCIFTATFEVPEAYLQNFDKA